jgi:hypothetical protein
MPPFPGSDPGMKVVPGPGSVRRTRFTAGGSGATGQLEYCTSGFRIGGKFAVDDS